MLGEVDRPHPALAELVADEVRPEPEAAVPAGQQQLGLELGEQAPLDQDRGEPDRVLGRVVESSGNLAKLLLRDDPALADEVEELGS